MANKFSVDTNKGSLVIRPTVEVVKTEKDLYKELSLPEDLPIKNSFVSSIIENMQTESLTNFRFDELYSTIENLINKYGEELFSYGNYNILTNIVFNIVSKGNGYISKGNCKIMISDFLNYMKSEDK